MGDIIDGRAIARELDETDQGRGRRDGRGRPAAPGPGGDPGRRRPRERRLCQPQGESVRAARRAQLRAPPARGDVAGRAAGADPPAQCRWRGAWHPLPGAVARTYRRAGRARGDPPGEGCRRFPPGQCRAADDRHGRHSAVHAAGGDEAARLGRARSGRARRAGHRPLEHRRQAGRDHAAGGGLHRDHRP